MRKKWTIPIAFFLVLAIAFILLKMRSENRLYGSSGNRLRSIDVEGKIVELGRQVLSEKDDRTIELGALTDFSWDRVCLVGPFTSDREINGLVGFRWRCATVWDMEVCLCEDYFSLLFVDRDNVIPVRIDTRVISVEGEGKNRCIPFDEGVRMLYCIENITWQDKTVERVTIRFLPEKGLESGRGE